MNLLRKKYWEPFTTGALIGILSWFANLSTDNFLGITTPFEHTAAFLIEPVANELRYFAQNTPELNWEWMLVLGVFLGAYTSSKLSGDRVHPTVPPLWQARFGKSVGKRMWFSFLGGFIMMYGARVAQGCTSGHGISGVLQFAVSSWIFVPVFGVTGIFLAKFLYRDAKGVA